MQSTIFRPALRSFSCRTTLSQLPKQPIRRTFASEAPGDVSKGDTSPPVPSNPAGGNRKFPIFVIGGVVFIMVAGRYIINSDKPFRSGHKEIQQARRRDGTSNERRDPRDSGVKTLADKKRKDERLAQES